MCLEIIGFASELELQDPSCYFVCFAHFVDRPSCRLKNGSTNYTNYTNYTKSVEFDLERQS